MATGGKTEFEKLAQKPNAQSFRIPRPPSLYEEMMNTGFKEGPRSWDEKMRKWCEDVEREINAKIVKAPTISAGDPG